jgi:hypothetical protein
VNTEHIKQVIGRTYRHYVAAKSCLEHNRSHEMKDIIVYVELMRDRIKSEEPDYDIYKDWDDNWLIYSNL